jgi:hypothetical protein
MLDYLYCVWNAFFFAVGAYLTLLILAELFLGATGLSPAPTAASLACEGDA